MSDYYPCCACCDHGDVHPPGDERNGHLEPCEHCDNPDVSDVSDRL